MPIHTTNFEAIKSLIVKAPTLYLPARTGQFYLEFDSSAKHVGSVLYQIQNGHKHVIAFYRATMPDATSRYSSSELELCGLKKSLLHFQYLLKYSTFTVLMDLSALKRIYASKKLAKMVHIQKYIWRKFKIFHSILCISLVNICLFVISCLIFHQIIKMRNQFHTSLLY